MSALANDVGDDPVDSDACEKHGKDREGSEKGHDEALGRHGVGNDVVKRLFSVDRLLTVCLFNHRPNRSQRSERVAFCSYDEASIYCPGRNELVRDLYGRVIDLRLVVSGAFGESDLFGMPNDSDNFPLLIHRGNVEPFSDWTFVGEILPG